MAGTVTAVPATSTGRTSETPQRRVRTASRRPPASATPPRVRTTRTTVLATCTGDTSAVPARAAELSRTPTTATSLSAPDTCTSGNAISTETTWELTARVLVAADHPMATAIPISALVTNTPVPATSTGSMLVFMIRVSELEQAVTAIMVLDWAHSTGP